MHNSEAVESVYIYIYIYIYTIITKANLCNSTVLLISVILSVISAERVGICELPVAILKLNFPDYANKAKVNLKSADNFLGDCG